jgi:hypothetical protein
MIDKYLVHSSGIKDHMYFICDKKHWEWVTKGTIPDDFDFKGIGEAEGWPDNKAEEWQREEIVNYSEDDRAMYLSWCKDAICFFDIHEYTKYITKNNINIKTYIKTALY